MTGRDFQTTTADRGGIGLHIMRHRANMIGGTLHIERSVDGDTVVRCQFPLQSQDSE